MARRCKHLWLALGALLGLLAAPGKADAYAEQASLDAAAGYLAIARAPRLPAHGATLDLGAGLGLGEAVVLRGALGYAHLRDDAWRAHAGRLRVEGLYLIDVLRAVPFVGVGASVLLAAGAGDAVRFHPGAHLVLGLDYLASRAWVVGLDVRTGIIADDGARSATEVGLRISHMLELF